MESPRNDGASDAGYRDVMTPSSLGDDSSTTRTTDADVAQQGRSPERVGSDGFVDAILSMAEQRAEADEQQSAATEVETPTGSSTEVAPLVEARVVSEDFIDAVLEVAEARVASAAAAAEHEAEPEALKRPVPASRSTRATATHAKRIAGSASSRTTTRPTSTSRASQPQAHTNADAELQLGYDRDSDDSTAHVHPTRPTPWWRKRPSLEVIFAIIATVLMVIGLALVISELF